MAWPTLSPKKSKLAAFDGACSVTLADGHGNNDMKAHTLLVRGLLLGALSLSPALNNWKASDITSRPMLFYRAANAMSGLHA